MQEEILNPFYDNESINCETVLVKIYKVKGNRVAYRITNKNENYYYIGEWEDIAYILEELDT